MGRGRDEAYSSSWMTDILGEVIEQKALVERLVHENATRRASTSLSSSNVVSTKTDVQSDARCYM